MAETVRNRGMSRPGRSTRPVLLRERHPGLLASAIAVARIGPFSVAGCPEAAQQELADALRHAQDWAAVS